MSTVQELRERQELLRDLRETGDSRAIAQADALQKTWHDEQMSMLADDVYDSAMHKGMPPPGWVRLSELLDDRHKELRDRLVPELSDISGKVLRDRLQPDESGFRAEIYIPDPSILGPGYQPTVVPKGSAGQVMTSKGLRDTTIEDFGGNNGPQAIGLKTDYYDRAMRLATYIQRSGLDVEYAGHSLGGGLATSMSAVTGEPATTFNAANLHPSTVSRFVAENPGTKRYGLSDIVTTYHVQDELLNPVVQDGIRGMSEPAREKAARMLTELANATEDPAVRRLMDKALPADLPRAARESLHDFLDEVAKKGHAEQALRDIPRPVSTPILLDEVKTRQYGLTGPLVDRTDPLPVRDVEVLAGPLLAAANTIAQGAKTGRTAGEVVAAGGRTTAHSADVTGDVVSATTRKAADFSDVVSSVSSTSARAGVHVAGETLARGREAAGRAEAAIDTVQGEVQARGAKAGASAFRGVSEADFLPDGLQRWAGRNADALEEVGEAARARNRSEAAEAKREAREDAQAIRATTQAGEAELERIVVVGQRLQRDVIEGAGERIDRGLDAGARVVDGVAQRAPTAGAAVGVAGVVAATANPLDLTDYPTLQRLARSGAETYKAGLPASQEIFERHLMTEAVVPSMEFRADGQEQKARALLESLRPDLEQQRSQPKAESPSQRIELETPQAHSTREQALHEANRLGLPPDVAQQVAQRETMAVPANFAPVRELPKDLRDQEHPGHDRYAASLDNVRRMEGQNGIASGPHSERLAAAVAIAVERDQLKVQRLDLDKSTGQVTVIERGPYPNFDERRVPIDTRQALGQSFEQSSQQWLEARSPHYAADAPKIERSREQSEALAQLTPADQTMFAKIREGIPATVSDDHVAQATLAAKRDGITDASKINQVAMVGDKLWVEGTVPGHRAAVDVSQPAPALQETAQQSQSFNQQRDIQLAQEAQQRSQNDPNQGPRMT